MHCCSIQKQGTPHLWLWKSVYLQTGGAKGVDVSKGSPEMWKETGGELRDPAKCLVGSVSNSRRNVRDWRARQEKIQITAVGKELPEFERKWL